MRVTVLAMKGMILDEEAREVRLPGEDGEISVLDFHQPFLYRLRKGYILVTLIRKETGGERRVSIKDGVARMSGNELTVVVAAQ
jgi:F0F1-type ATP synthase epsilon subunit